MSSMKGLKRQRFVSVDYCVGLLVGSLAAEDDRQAATCSQCSRGSRVKLRQVRPTTDSFPAPCSTLLARRHWPDPVQVVRPGVQVSAQHGSWIRGRLLLTCLQHRQPQTSPICKSWSTAGSADINIRKPSFWTRRSIYLEDGTFSRTFLNAAHTLYLLLDAI